MTSRFILDIMVMYLKPISQLRRRQCIQPTQQDKLLLEQMVATTVRGIYELQGLLHQDFGQSIEAIEAEYEKQTTEPWNQCTCANPGKDDGEYTCPIHHDCSRGDCTHRDYDEEGE